MKQNIGNYGNYIVTKGQVMWTDVLNKLYILYYSIDYCIT